MGGVKPCSDLSAADWLVGSAVPWQQLVTFGPGEFSAYARLRFIADPAFDGQHESDAVSPALGDDEQVRRVLAVLSAHTSTPEDCYFCVWDGFGDLGGPKVVVPHRAYHLFAGPLSSAGSSLAFVWPADHAWCVARDVDPHWAGIGASEAVVGQLIADARFDVVAADPSVSQPAYR